MKKQMPFLAVLFSLPFLSFAQEYNYVPFPDSGIVWSERYYPKGDMAYDPARQIFERFALSGEDTLINNKLYKKLYLFYDSVFNKSKAAYIGGIREDSLKRVYYLGDTVHYSKPRSVTNELMLYNFSLNVGDTISDYYWHNVFSNLVVKDIDTVQIGNSLRKKFTFNYSHTEWIEGIGSIEGLLFRACPLLTGTYLPDNTLVCVIQNDTILYHNEEYSSCFPSTVGVEIKQKHFKINVFPNPANGRNICFELGNSNIVTIEIFNMQSSQIGYANTKGKAIVEFSIGIFQPGIYVYKVTEMNGTIQTGKFAVQ